MCNLRDKVALVTGAASKQGIGRAISLRLAREGAQLVLVDRYLPPQGLSENDQAEGWQGLLSVAEEIKTIGQEALAVQADISDLQQVKSATAAALSRFGRIDILVNNAGIQHAVTPIVEFDEQLWQKVITINLTGTFLFSKIVAKAMIEKGTGGKIINVASIAGKIGLERFGAYCASKAGIISLTQTMATELAPNKINVNAICPGHVATEISPDLPQIRSMAKKRGLSLEQAIERVYSRLTPSIPLGRVAQPEEVANVAAFLASPESDYITGEAISITGGWLLGH